MSRTSRRAAFARPARLTLSRRFALISLLGIAVVATGVVVATAQVMRQQSISEGARSAETLTDWVAPMVPMEAFQTGVLDDARRAALAEATARLDGSVLSLRWWNVDGIMLFDSASDSTSAFPNSGQLESAAIMGEAAARIGTHVAAAGEGEVGSTRTALDVYVPVRAGGHLVGAAEVTFDHTPAADTQARAVRTIALAAGAGLLLLWLVLYRTVHTASQSLQRSAMDNARMALLDSLTGLPNRRMLLGRLERAVNAAHRGGPGVGVLLLDIDRFKEVNDTLGHDHGDDLLQQAADRLHRRVATDRRRRGREGGPGPPRPLDRNDDDGPLRVPTLRGNVGRDGAAAGDTAAGTAAGHRGALVRAARPLRVAGPLARVGLLTDPEVEGGARLDGGNLDRHVVVEGKKLAIRNRSAGGAAEVVALLGERRRVDRQPLVQGHGGHLCLPARPSEIGIEVAEGAAQRRLHESAVADAQANPLQCVGAAKADVSGGNTEVAAVHREHPPEHVVADDQKPRGGRSFGRSCQVVGRRQVWQGLSPSTKDSKPALVHDKSRRNSAPRHQALRPR